MQTRERRIPGLSIFDGYPFFTCQFLQAVQQLVGRMYRPVIAQRNARRGCTTQIVDTDPAMPLPERLQDFC
jgi:hypothetical protein